MGSYIQRRILQSIVVLFIVTLIVFFVMKLLPGNPAQIMLGTEASPEEIQALEEKLGLNDPVLVQYFRWLGGALTGDLGTSIFYNQDVFKLIMERIPVTLIIGLSAFCIEILIGIPLGIIAGIKRGTYIDSLIVVLGNFGIATPNFWVAIIAVYIISLKLGWLPVQGYVSPLEDPVAAIMHLILPILVLGTNGIGSLARHTRSSVLEVIRQDYIRTARSKGLKKKVVITKHVLRNALLPIVTIQGFQIGHLLGGSVLIETVFNLPGMGRLLVDSIFQKDYIVVQACVLLIGTTVVFVNLLVDIAYRYIDPRIKYE